MPAPTPILVQRDIADNTVLVVFSEDLGQVSGVLDWDDGFTISVDGTPDAITAATKVTSGILFALTANIVFGSIVSVEYSGTNLQSLDVVPVAVAAFDEVATDAPAIPLLLSALIPEDTPNTVELTFAKPIASLGGDLSNGVGLTANGVGVSILAATFTQSAHLTRLTVTLPNSFSYNQDVQFFYTDSVGDWVSPVDDEAVPSFDTVVDNNSTIGEPDSEYPLSTATVEELAVVNGVATAVVTLALNPVDIAIVNQFGPAYVDVGGSFATTTVNPPAGYFVSSRQVALRDGVQITQTFSQPGNTAWTIAAAEDWQTQIRARIAVALGSVRTIAAANPIAPKAIYQV